MSAQSLTMLSGVLLLFVFVPGAGISRVGEARGKGTKTILDRISGSGRPAQCRVDQSMVAAKRIDGIDLCQSR